MARCIAETVDQADAARPVHRHHRPLARGKGGAWDRRSDRRSVNLENASCQVVLVRGQRRDRIPIQKQDYPHIIVGLIAAFLLPLILGIHDLNPAGFIVYAVIAGALFTLGEWAVAMRFSEVEWVELLVDCCIKTVTMFVVGGFFYIFALVAL